MSKRRTANVAAKARRYVCSRLGHAYPRDVDAHRARCTRCGEWLNR